MNINETVYCSACMRELETEGICPYCGYDPARTPIDEALEEGTLLCDRRYELGAALAKGGFGITYAAWDRTLQSAVAIKEFFPASYASRDTWESDEVIVSEEDQLSFGICMNAFITEARVLSALKNVPNVVAVQDLFEQNNTGYIVMEFVRGVTLGEYVKTHPIGSDELLRMLRGPIDTLALVHQQGILHRDIAPKNFMVTDDGTIKLIDFGAAMVLDNRAKKKQIPVGLTRHFAAIEQYDPRMAQGQWTDVYGLSATIYALLTGEAPPEATDRSRRDSMVSPKEACKGLTRQQERALVGGLAVDPEDRLRSVDEFRAMLYNLPTPEIVRQRKRMVRRMSALTAAVIALTLLIACNFLTGFPLDGRQRYSLRQDGWHILGAVGQHEERSLPERLLFLPVTAISEGAFENDEALRSVRIPGSVASVPRFAFSGCGRLETVMLEEGVREIDAYAFGSCDALHTVELPDSIVRIDPSAFENAQPYLTAWINPDSDVRLVCGEAGIGCAEKGDFLCLNQDGTAVLQAYIGEQLSVHVPSYIDGVRVTRITDEVGANVFPLKLERVTLPYYLEEIPSYLFYGYTTVPLCEVVIGPYVQRIGVRAFENTSIESIHLPDSLRVIEEKAFYSSSLREVNLPYGLESIGKEAFYVTMIEEITIPQTVTQIGGWAFSSDALHTVHIPPELSIAQWDDFFYGCRDLKMIRLPDSIKTLEMSAFSGCTSLEAIELPEGLEEIDYNAFGDCFRLRYVGIPATVTEIDDQAFVGCGSNMVIAGYPGTEAQRFADEKGFVFEDKSLWSADLVTDGVIETSRAAGSLICPAFDPQTNDIVRVVSRVSSVVADWQAPDFTHIRLPVLAEVIDSAALYGEETVTRVDIPESVRIIYNSAFNECPALETIELPDKLEYIGAYAFADCSSLRSVHLSDSIRLIDQGAFEGCTSLSEFTVPTGINYLPAYVFKGTAIESVVIPSNITACSGAFMDCTQLRRVVIEDGVRELRGTFSGCSALETVIIEGKTDTIDGDAFSGCTSLQEITFMGDVDRLSYSANGTSYLFYEKSAEQVMAKDRTQMEHMFSACPDVTIRAPEGGLMEMYANCFGLKFESIGPSQKGDASGI